ncbi:cytochrome c5 family protein [Chitinibacter bivalviorum]|uniref:Cytochrome c5 family protein n=1 Tax=Chitinibacter bivalviorum TaxID=2739434 RepID=A0A7H9BF62_9NEIS|nr:c-type cytochrome [Chitinibacter bivalviorum]QLG87205.1 cytochrome c5 family protein [Chitinibacter bivalviorum]
MGGSNATASKGVAGMILAALIGVPLVVYLLIKLFTSGMATNLTSTTMTNEAVSARLQPVGAVKIVEGGAPGSRSGKSVFEGICISCHGAGLAGAPKFGDAAAWGPRIAQGYDTLVKHALGGFKAMPAKGGAADLTDDEVKRAVAYMGNAGGAKFEEPKVAGAAAGAAVDPNTKGKEIYASTCVACHGSGAAGAPKFGDKAAWAPRLKDGVDAAIAIGVKGLNAMPPKGGYSGSDDEFKAAATYMINNSK